MNDNDQSAALRPHCSSEPKRKKQVGQDGGGLVAEVVAKVSEQLERKLMKRRGGKKRTEKNESKWRREAAVVREMEFK